MKRLFVAVLLLAVTSSAVAGLVELRVSPDDAFLYIASDTITIQLYATDFYTDYPYDTIGFMDIAAIKTDNGGTASSPGLHTALQPGVGVSTGDIVNSGGILIEDIRGYIEQDDLVGVYPFPAVLYEFEFHIPDIMWSTIITISLDGLSLKNLGYNDPVPYYTQSTLLELHLAVPEPATFLLFGLGGLLLRKRH